MVLRGVSQPSLRFCQPLEGAGNFMFIYFESCFESGSDSVAFFSLRDVTMIVSHQAAVMVR